MTLKEIVLNYFDLNKRALKGKTGVFSDSIEIHGDVIASKRGGKKQIEHKDFSLSKQIIMYFGVFTGVLFSKMVQIYELGGNIDFFNLITIGNIFVSFLIALVILPYIYQKLSLNQDAPFLIQFGIFFQNGLFWNVIINSIGKMI
jgi:hypothetical protein